MEAEFIDRKNELAFLEENWNDADYKAKFIILWGKRRVGKTELVKEFIKDKPKIYFLSENTSNNEQLKRFSQAVGNFFNEPLLKVRGFSEWEESFDYIKRKNEKFILVIDEFPYLIQSNPVIPSLFQKAWDEYWSKTKLYLIILGSSVSIMENEVLGYKSPLYGRRTAQYKIDPMPFNSIGLFRKHESFEDRMMHYALGGGIPAYWLQFSEKKDFYGNLRDHVLKKGQFLYEEVEFVLREELREPRYYFALLQAIAQGKRKLSEIVNATGVTQSAANKYLSVLSDLGIVEREIPVTEEKPLKSKKGLYRIKDEFFAFWFAFVFPSRSRIEIGESESVIEEIKAGLDRYISFVYERVAIQILLNNSEKLFRFSALGRWWDKNQEIDIIGINPSSNSIVFCEVKWSKKPVGLDIYENLKQKTKLVDWGEKNRKEFYCLFSKSGFTEAMIKLARKENAVLFSGENPA